jgi:hypothetical protein
MSSDVRVSAIRRGMVALALLVFVVVGIVAVPGVAEAGKVDSAPAMASGGRVFDRAAGDNDNIIGHTKYQFHSEPNGEGGGGGDTNSVTVNGNVPISDRVVLSLRWFKEMLIAVFLSL